MTPTVLLSPFDIKIAASMDPRQFGMCTSTSVWVFSMSYSSMTHILPSHIFIFHCTYSLITTLWCSVQVEVKDTVHPWNTPISASWREKVVCIGHSMNFWWNMGIFRNAHCVLLINHILTDCVALKGMCRTFALPNYFRRCWGIMLILDRVMSFLCRLKNFNKIY